MKRWIIAAACALGAAACQDQQTPTEFGGLQPGAASLDVTVDPALTAALTGATDTDVFEVIVNYDPSTTTLDAVTGAILELGAGVIQFKHLSMVAVQATSTQIAAIQTLPGVQSLYLNRELRYLNAEGLVSTNASRVHDELKITGEGVGIAILDSGIDGLHPDLLYPDKTVQNVKYVATWKDLFSFKGKDDKPLRKAANIFVEDVVNSETSIGHGTHVAGTAAGSGAASGGHYRGMAPDAKLIGIGAGDVLFIFWILAGFDYILDNQEKYNIQVVNNSWGSEGEFDADDPINEATREVHDAGITVVFAGGNSGPDKDTMNPYSVAPWVISVAAGCKFPEDPTNSGAHCVPPFDAGDDWESENNILSDFSSRGIPGDPLYRPDITAPGVHIVSARASTGTVMNGLDANHDARICNIKIDWEVYYTCASGTSMAAPHIAGIVGLMEDAARRSGYDLTPDQALKVLTATARPLPGYGVWEVGAGYVDALAAVQSVLK